MTDRVADGLRWRPSTLVVVVRSEWGRQLGGQPAARSIIIPDEEDGQQRVEANVGLRADQSLGTGEAHG